MYKQCVEFRKLNSKHWSENCVICYLQIIPSQNIGFACSHNSCISCFTYYLKLSINKKEGPCCFVCRNMICYMDVDNMSSQKTIMNIINPPTDLVLYQPPSAIEQINRQRIDDHDDEVRLYHPMLLFDRNFRLFYAVSQSSFCIFILFIGYYLIR